MKLAVIADTHGNLLALDAVLSDLRGAAPDVVVNLGDLVSGPFDPAGSADRQMALTAATLAGNHDRQVCGDGTLFGSDAFARPRLSNRHLAWLAGLPSTLSLCDGAVFACHGSPAGGDLDYLLEDVATGLPVLAAAHAIRPRLAGIDGASLVLCGHTHTPRAVAVDGVLVVNPGSVGMPAYTDDDPLPHSIETGSPHARYALVTRSPKGWSAEFRLVEYDWEAAAHQAIANGRPDAAHWIATGRAQR